MQATSKIKQLPNYEKQCYIYAAVLAPNTYNYDTVSNKITLPTETILYDEKSLLKNLNVGLFGFGVYIPIGSEDSKLTVTNYNYV